MKFCRLIFPLFIILAVTNASAQQSADAKLERVSICSGVTFKVSEPIVRENMSTLKVTFTIEGDLNVPFSISGGPANLVDNEGNSWGPIAIANQLGISNILQPGIKRKVQFPFSKASGGRNVTSASFSITSAGIVDRSQGYKTIANCSIVLKDIPIVGN